MALVGQLGELGGLCRYVTRMPSGDLAPNDVTLPYLLCCTSLGLGLGALDLGPWFLGGGPWALPWALGLGALGLVLV